MVNDLRLLRHFVAVYRERSFRSAADKLGVAQSSVTKRVVQLEQQLGTRLFNRTTRTVEPTDTARQLVSYAEHTLQAAGAFTEEARLLAGGQVGKIRVGAIALAAETLVVRGLAKLAQSHPSLEVDVVVGGADIYRDLAIGECDLVVGDEANFEMSVHGAALAKEPIQQEQLVFVLRRNHPAGQSATLGELLRYPLAVPSRYFNENRLFSDLFDSTAIPQPPGNNATTTPRYRLNSLSACLSLAAGSDVVTLAPKSLVTTPKTTGPQAELRVLGLDTGIQFNLVLVRVAKNTPTPAMRAFRQALAAP